MMLRRADAARTRSRSGSGYVVRYVRWLGMIATLMIAAAPRAAFAHAHLVKSAPGAGTHVPLSPQVIKLWYSEAAEATMTTITVTGRNGIHARIGPISADASDPLLLIVPVISPLQAGKYLVAWHAIAKDDGHPSQGSFEFVVDSNPEAVAGVIGGTDARTAAPGPVVAGAVDQRAAGTGSMQDMEMDVEAPSYVLARWLNFVSLIALIGVIAFRVLVIPRVVARDDVEQFEPFISDAIRRAATLGVIAAVTLLIAGIARLYAQRAVVGAGMDVATILHSFWGHIWLVQTAVAIAGCIAFALARARRNENHEHKAWLAAAVAVLILGAVPAFSGHAMASQEDRSLSVALDIIHVLAAGGWVGSLVALVVAGVPAALALTSDLEAPRSISAIASLVNAFSPIALVFAGIVIVSGLVAAWLRIGSLPLLFRSTYGTVLLIKLAFVMLVLACGAFNWLRMRGALSHQDAESSSIAAFRRSAWLELTAATLVIAATAVLVAAQPPIH